MVEKAIWSQLTADGGELPDTLGSLGGGDRSEPLAITQLLLLYHLLEASLSRQRYSGFSKSKRHPASHSERWLP